MISGAIVTPRGRCGGGTIKPRWKKPGGCTRGAGKDARASRSPCKASSTPRCTVGSNGISSSTAIGGYFGNLQDPARVARVADAPVWEAIAQRLAAWPRVLVHRDFQSQNILIHDGQAHLIDFQGLRPGLAHYDLASLLYDPYVRLSPAERG